VRALFTAFVVATIFIGTIVSTAEAMVTGINAITLTNTIEKVRCYCGQYGCSCVPRSWPGYRYRNYGYGSLRPYAYYGYGYRPSPYYGYRR
jgi:hypothetical protein